MLDTTVFNHILRDGIELDGLPHDKRLFATHVQPNEIQNTSNDKLRNELLNVFSDVATEKVPTSSAVWDVSEYGEAEWGSEDGVFEALLSTLNKMNKNKKNNSRDILIAETAIRHNMTLVTDDADLSATVNKHNGSVITLQEFISE
ncbi:hypothetical protein [Sulfuriflexus mobilis]|uniref:hypothetical protein n=1 Tax=Sulfuriflexus mobilis TaxID=1811807 RepID=UPI000F82B37C|nr:hypothetical protein [Sulfuriflexus mobilis]